MSEVVNAFLSTMFVLCVLCVLFLSFKNQLVKLFSVDRRMTRSSPVISSKTSPRTFSVSGNKAPVYQLNMWLRRAFAHAKSLPPKISEGKGVEESQGALGGKSDDAAVQSMRNPPFTSSISPVMKSALSDARKRTASATSSGLPNRFRGMASMMDLRFSSDH